MGCKGVFITRTRYHDAFHYVYGKILCVPLNILSSALCIINVSIVSFKTYNLFNKAFNTRLSTELSDFDILAFSETWLHTNIQTADLLIPDFQPPERKDRTADRHGGVMIYVKDTLFYKRRHDLEPRNLECIWIEIQLNHTRVLLVFTIARQTLMRRTSLALKILYRLHWIHK